ncbi:MAG TPA: hypothetical protein VGG16_29975, partial [Streptosporangiaceae bacterium]
GCVMYLPFRYLRARGPVRYEPPRPGDCRPWRRRASPARSGGAGRPACLVREVPAGLAPAGLAPACPVST